MRAIAIILALITAPFAMSAAQGYAHSSEHCAALRAVLENTPAHSKARANALKRCAPAAPEEPPPTEEPPPSHGGTAWISGALIESQEPWGPLAGWTVTLSGTVNTSILTSDLGEYEFMGLPAGTYMICVDIPAGWTQTFPTWGPTCPTGIGHSFPLEDGTGGTFNHFRFVPE